MPMDYKSTAYPALNTSSTISSVRRNLSWGGGGLQIGEKCILKDSRCKM